MLAEVNRIASAPAHAAGIEEALQGVKADRKLGDVPSIAPIQSGMKIEVGFGRLILSLLPSQPFPAPR